MNVHIAKDGMQMGPYSLEELNARLASEVISGDDLCWYEGREDWIPVSQLPRFVPPHSKQEPPPVPTAQPQKEAQELNSTAPSNGQWYYSERDQKIGPHALDEVIRLIRANLLQRDVLVWHGGMKEWAPAYQTELSKYFDEDANRSVNDPFPLSWAMPLLTSESSKQPPQYENEKKPSPFGAFHISKITPFLRIGAILCIGYFAIKAALKRVENWRKDTDAMNQHINAYALRTWKNQPEPTQNLSPNTTENERKKLDVLDVHKKQIPLTEIEIVDINTKNPLKSSIHIGGGKQIQDPNIDRVRNGILPIDDTRTLGDVFEKSKVKTNPRWRSFEATSGANVVEVEGDIQEPDKLWTEFNDEIKQIVKEDPVNFLKGAGSQEAALMGIMGMNILSNLPVKLECLSYKVQFLLSKSDKGKFQLGIQKCTVRAKNTTTGKTIQETFEAKENAIIDAFYEDEVSRITSMALMHLQTSQTLKEALIATDHASASPTQTGDVYIVPSKAPPVPKSGYLPPTGENSGKDTGLDKNINASVQQPTSIERYKKSVSSAVGSRWNYHIQQRMSLLKTGKVTAIFSLDERGKVRSFRIEENTSNRAHAALIQQCVREAEFGPPPPEALRNGAFEYPMSFHLK